MITEKLTFQFVGNTTSESITYTISADNNCMAITPATGVVTPGTKVDFVFSLVDATCYTSEITLSGIDQDGCKTTDYKFYLEDSCSTLAVNLINQPVGNNNNSFVASITGGNSPYSINWDFDPTLFTPSSGLFGNVLILNPNGTVEVFPDLMPIGVTVTDSKGCSVAASINHELCRPIITSGSITASCVTEYFNSNLKKTVKYEAGLTLSGTACAGTEIDWSTLEAYSNNEYIIVDNTLSPVIKIYITKGLTVADILVSPDFNISLYVKDNKGIKSPVANIDVLIAICRETVELPARGRNKIVELTPAQTVTSSVIEIPIGEDVFAAPDEELDWDTFTFVAGTGQSTPKPETIISTNGTGVLNCDKAIEYTVGTQTENLDLLQFKIDTKSGKTSNVTKLVIDFEATTAPSLTTDTVTVLGGSSTVISVLDNDTGDFDLTSLEVVTKPTKGTATVNTDGTITYFSSNQGSDSFTYKISNTNGVESSAATVNITINNSGVGATTNVCPVAGVDLTSYLSGFVTSGGTWTQNVSNPSALVITTPTAVDFSSGSAGTYEFTYTVGAAATTITLVMINSTLTIDSTSTPTINPFNPANPKSTVNFSATNISDINAFEMEVNFNTGTNIDYYPITNYDGSTGSVTIEYAEGAGSYVATLSATDKCGIAKSDTFTKVI